MVRFLNIRLIKEMLYQSGFSDTARRYQCHISSIHYLLPQEFRIVFSITKVLSDKYLPTTKGFLIKKSSIPFIIFIANIIIIIAINNKSVFFSNHYESARECLSVKPQKN